MQLEKLEKLGSELTVFKEPNELMVSNFFIKGDFNAFSEKLYILILKLTIWTLNRSTTVRCSKDWSQKMLISYWKGALNQKVPKDIEKVASCKLGF